MLISCYCRSCFCREAEQQSETHSQRFEDIRAKRHPRGHRHPTPSVHFAPFRTRAAAPEREASFSVFVSDATRVFKTSLHRVPLLFHHATDLSPGAKPLPPSFCFRQAAAILCQTLPQSEEGSFESVKKMTQNGTVERGGGAARATGADPTFRVQSSKYPRYCEEKTV